ncbi:MAG: lipase family protein [Cyanobacteria bacterium J06649_4]
MKFNRRALLWVGLGASAAVTGIKEKLRTQALQSQAGLSSPAQNTLKNHLSIMSAAYSSEAGWEEEVERRKTLLSFDQLRPPELPYSRDLSKLMMTFCKLAVQQYKTGREDPSYGGEINLLPAYSRTLKDYEQIADFTIEEEIIEEYFKENEVVAPEGIVGNATLDDELKAVELTLHDRVRQILQRKYRISVFSGIALTAQTHNVLVFRGTQTQSEWLKNLNAAQVPYVAPDGTIYGEVHEGFYKLMQSLKPSLAEVVGQLDPTLPCYVTGHSLGAAIATLAAMEISYLVPEMRENIQLYTYAGPRVGSPTFATAYSERLPNAYRVVNLGDTVPLVPPVTMGNSYVHVGEEWSFIFQSGDTLLNHVVDTYRAALEQELESNQNRSLVAQLQLD